MRTTKNRDREFKQNKTSLSQNFFFFWPFAFFSHYSCNQTIPILHHQQDQSPPPPPPPKQSPVKGSLFSLSLSSLIWIFLLCPSDLVLVPFGPDRSIYFISSLDTHKLEFIYHSFALLFLICHCNILKH